MFRYQKAANIIAALVLFSALSMQLLVRVEVMQKAYRLEDLRQQALTNDLKLRDLKMNYAWLGSPNSIEEKASTSLGLQDTARQFVIRLDN